MKKAAVLSSMRESNDAELKARVARTEEELFQHRLKRHTNQLENTNLIRSAKRDIARAKTIVSQRQHGIEKGKE
jgi:large subunit ribosomal protein L29